MTDLRGARPVRVSDPSAILLGLAGELAAMDAELEELGLLATQVADERVRHEQQRDRMEDWVVSIEADPATTAEQLRDARAQLLLATRRAALFEGQQQVVEGKQRTLRAHRARLAELHDALEPLLGAARPAPATVPAERPPGFLEPAALLRAQETLRRDIVRQMHDGPAQSLANVVLQVEIVERLARTGDPRMTAEFDALRAIVQGALDRTRAFIFDIHPMVLDDLGLLPSIRRMVAERADRAGIRVDFESAGAAVRLHPDLESGLYRILSETTAAILRLHPASMTVTLDWTGAQLFASAEGRWDEAAGAPDRAATPARDLPPVLRAMMDGEARAGREAREVSRAIPATLLTELAERARILGIAFAVRSGATGIDLSVATA